MEKKNNLHKNPFLNFLDVYRQENADLSAVDIIKYGAEAWRSMSEAEKSAFAASADSENGQNNCDDLEISESCKRRPRPKKKKKPCAPVKKPVKKCPRKRSKVRKRKARSRRRTRGRGRGRERERGRGRRRARSRSRSCGKRRRSRSKGCKKRKPRRRKSSC